MIKQIIFVILLAGGLLLPCAIFGLWWQFTTVMVFFICFGIVEWVAVIKSGKTVSQHFWELKKQSPLKAWIVIICWAIAWIALLWHFIG